MTTHQHQGCNKSQAYFLETCIDGNACKETTKDKRWVRKNLTDTPDNIINAIFFLRFEARANLPSFIKFTRYGNV